jgi:hypothetical protein
VRREYAAAIEPVLRARALDAAVDDGARDALSRRLARLGRAVESDGPLLLALADLRELMQMSLHPLEPVATTALGAWTATGADGGRGLFREARTPPGTVGALLRGASRLARRLLRLFGAAGGHNSPRGAAHRVVGGVDRRPQTLEAMRPKRFRRPARLRALLLPDVSAKGTGRETVRDRERAKILRPTVVETNLARHAHGGSPGSCAFEPRHREGIAWALSAFEGAGALGASFALDDVPREAVRRSLLHARAALRGETLAEAAAARGRDAGVRAAPRRRRARGARSREVREQTDASTFGLDVVDEARRELVALLLERGLLEVEEEVPRKAGNVSTR